MQFESRAKRNFWGAIILSLIPDIIIASILTNVFNGGLLGFLAAIVGLWLLYLAIWIKNSVWNWTIFLVRGRKRMAQLLFDRMKENNFPNPNTYEKSAISYLEAITESQKWSIDVRLKAAADLGALNCYIDQGHLQAYSRISIAYEDAIEKYNNYKNGEHI